MDKDPFDGYQPDLFGTRRLSERALAAVDWIAQRLSPFGDVQLCLSEYPKHPERAGAAEMLDGELYDIPETVELGQE